MSALRGFAPLRDVCSLHGCSRLRELFAPCS